MFRNGNDRLQNWFSRFPLLRYDHGMAEEKSEKPAHKSAADRRAERLKAELRANLARRKVQARARRAGAEDDRPGELISGGGREAE